MKQFVKRLLGGVLGGAATTIGSILVMEGYKYLSNPVNRANIKRKFKGLKFKISKREEA